MICVSIGRGRHKHMIAEHRYLAEQGVKLVELRLDYIKRDVSLKRLLADRPCPVIVTCRREADGGKWTGGEEQRQMLLRAAIAEGVEYVDLEEDIAAKIPRYGKTKRIISLHDFRETPKNLREIHQRLAALDADIVKIAGMAHSTRDNLRMLNLIRESKQPTIGICMGEIGAPTRLLAGKFGAPFSYAAFHGERTLAPGQLSYKQMRELYAYERINADTEVYGVIADPIGHSLSPVAHNAAFRELKLNKVYVPFRVPREDLQDFLTDCHDLDVRGLSVTIPHKEDVLPLLNEMDEAVKGIGACNTIVFDPYSRIGYNTDNGAAMASLEREMKHRGDSLKGKTALVLGAGGVSRALAYGLMQREADVVISGRTEERARLLAAQMGCRSIPWEKRSTIKPHVLINGTPVGMHPDVDETPFDVQVLSRDAIVFDTVYNPEQTLLIKHAKSVGCTYITGIDMFVGQAAMQFKLFTGREAPTDLMRKVVKQAISAARY